MKETWAVETPADKQAPVESWRFSLIFTALYLFVVLAAMLRHEPWRDELQAWTLARDNATLGSLMQSRRYDGHPPLWHLLLWGLSRLFTDPFAMQLLHLGICSATALLVSRFAPLRRAEKLALMAGFFMAYEYAVISRAYSIGVLALVAFAVLHTRAPAKNRFWQWLLLGVVVSVSAHGFVLGGCLAIWLLLHPSQWPLNRTTLFGVIQFALAAGASLLLTLPPADSGYAVGWTLYFSPAHLCRALATIWQAYVPIPLLITEFHDTNILSGADLRWVALYSVLLVAGTTVWLKKTRVRAFYLLATGSLVAFSYLKFIGYNRHSGHLYLLWLLCLWLDHPTGGCHGWRRALLRGVLCIHVAAAGWAFAIDWREPFSTSRRAADLVRSSGLGHLPIVGLPDHLTAPLAAWLNKPIYFADSRRWGTFVIWDNHREEGTPRDLLQQIGRVGDDVVFVANRPFHLKNVRGVDFTEVGQLPGGIVPSERYYVYRVRRRAQPSR
jgi:hypothetical protein